MRVAARSPVKVQPPQKPLGKAALTAEVKKAFEAAMKKSGGGAFYGDATIFPLQKKVDGRSLVGAAKEALKGYDATARDGLRNGPGPFALVAHLKDGQKIFVVGGDLSDTGSQLDFFNAKGELLASAYSGQGANPNAAGVDWVA